MTTTAAAHLHPLHLDRVLGGVERLDSGSSPQLTGFHPRGDGQLLILFRGQYLLLILQTLLEHDVFFHAAVSWRHEEKHGEKVMDITAILVDDDDDNDDDDDDSY